MANALYIIFMACMLKLAQRTHGCYVCRPLLVPIHVSLTHLLALQVPFVYVNAELFFSFGYPVHEIKVTSWSFLLCGN